MALPKKIPLGDNNQKKYTPPPLPEIEDNKPIISYPEDEGEFVALDSEEVEMRDSDDEYQDDGLDNYLNEEAKREEELRAKELYEANNKSLIDDPFEEGSEPEVDDDEFIDKKKIKIKPFGGSKSKRKSNTVRAKDFDDRKNSLIIVRISRLVTFIFIIGMFGFGIKNTFFPSHVYTQDDITAISKQAVGQTGFPMNRGRALAEQFTQAYFEVNSKDDNSRRVYKSFFGGGTEAIGSEVNYSGDNNQKVLVAPKTFSEQAVSDKVAYFNVSTLVSGRDGKSFSDNGQQLSKWVALAVTVYYDSKTQQLSIAKDSPQLIPSFDVGNNSAQPAESPLGTGVANSDLFEDMGSTIKGYVKAYASSSIDSHGELDQYVKNESDPSVFAGFAGRYTLDTDNLDSSSVSIYPVSDVETNNEWKVDLRLVWEDASSTSVKDKLTFSGRYIMTLEKSKDGKYFVTAFRPYVFTPVVETEDK